MDIGIAQLVAGGVSPTAARALRPHLAAPLARFGLTTPARAGAFLAQCHVESAAFTRLEENLFYTTPARIAACFPSAFATAALAAAFVRLPERLANRAYAGRLGNGPEASGDGWRYRGRGLVQLTGRANYARAAKATGRPWLETPELLRDWPDAVLAAAWFWGSVGGNALADAGDTDAITRRVNGPAMLHAAQRRGATTRFVKALKG